MITHGEVKALRYWRQIGFGVVGVAVLAASGFYWVTASELHREGRYAFKPGKNLPELRPLKQVATAIRNYSEIEEGLYLGAACVEPPPGTTATLNVCQVEDPYRTEVYRWEAIHDGPPAPSVAWLRKQVEFIDEQRRAGRQVYVHCHAGASRSAMVTAAYLMWRDEIGLETAVSRLKEKRREVGINSAFWPLLAKWEEEIRRDGRRGGGRGRNGLRR